MEQEIDLRPYLQALMRRWRLIMGLIVTLSVLAAIWTMTTPRQVQARGDLLIIPKSSQLTLDPRFTEGDSVMLTNAVYQRQALVDLATSTTLEARVAEHLGLDSYQPGMLLGEIEVKATSDLLQIIASATTPAEATRLAETWTTEYERLINELFNAASPLTSQLDDQITGAQQRFDETQGALNDFYASGDLVRADQQVQRLDGLLNGGTEAQVRLYTEYLTRTQELNLILEDARSLQAQYAAEESPDLAAGLSALAVRARLAGAEQLPVQLSFDSAESFAQGQATGAELTSFVTVLEQERDRMIGQADALARALAAGDGTSVGLSDNLRASYETELAKAQGALARAEGQEELLIQRRDVALASLKALQSRRDESQISQAAPEVSVRFVGASGIPPRALATSLTINVAVAAILGLMIAIVLIIGLELWQRARSDRSTTPAPKPGERPVSSD